jgi:hypothetical protein
MQTRPRRSVHDAADVYALATMTGVNTAKDEKKQGRDEGDEKQERQVAQAPFQPLRPNSPGSEQDFVEVENPKRSRDEKQTNADRCVSKMQNHVIIHDGFICSGIDWGTPLAVCHRTGTTKLGHPVRPANVSPPDRSIVRTIEHLRQFLLDLYQPAFPHI